MEIPTKLTEIQFKTIVEPHLSKAKRGYVCKIPRYKMFNYILYLLHTGCQWRELPIDYQYGKPEISWNSVYHHFCKWSKDGSLEKLFRGSILQRNGILNLSEMQLDGSHIVSKKGALT